MLQRTTILRLVNVNTVTLIEDNSNGECWATLNWLEACRIVGWGCVCLRCKCRLCLCLCLYLCWCCIEIDWADAGFTETSDTPGVVASQERK